MSVSIILSMSVFALAASVSPGPVNLVCLSTGIRHSIRQGLIFVTGATLGFVVLFLCIGFGLHSLLARFPGFERWLGWAAVTFLLYLSYRLARDDGNIPKDGSGGSAGFFTGALMQWLNPKAWLASAAGTGAYTNVGEPALIWVFAGLYLPICWLSLSCWVYAGAFLRHLVHQPRALRHINRTLAVLLAASCALFLFD